VLAILEAQPAMMRELILRRIVEAWLAEQPKASGAWGAAKGSDGED